MPGVERGQAKPKSVYDRQRAESEQVQRPLETVQMPLIEERERRFLPIHPVANSQRLAELEEVSVCGKDDVVEPIQVICPVAEGRAKASEGGGGFEELDLGAGLIEIVGSGQARDATTDDPDSAD
jgi:hypothetical protein